MLLLSLLVHDANAKDLRQHLGVGFDTAFSPVPAASVKYTLPAPSPAITFQVQAVLGFSVLDNTDDTWFAGGRALYGLVAEDNMNLMAGLGAGYMQQGNRKGLRLQPSLGAEFFPFGLENLGFTAEGGLTMDLSSGPDLFMSAGIGAHYWF